MTASLSGFLSSLIYGALVVGVIGGALVFISKTDRVSRS